MRHTPSALLVATLGSLTVASLVAACGSATAQSPTAPPATSPAAPPALSAEALAALPLVTVNGDDVVITESCRVTFAGVIADTNGNGVVQITGSNIVVDCLKVPLVGADAKATPDTFRGTGIVVTGKNVLLRNAVVRGFRCGILAQGSDGSTFEKLVLSDNAAMRLLSSSRAEDGADWLWPHENDNREWVTRYGAGLCIERSKGVTVRDVTVRTTQNGIILDRVDESRIYDNDCSFLSGWGLAMWRSSDNVVCRNAFDFCIRGYSHGAYNRGQDSAGILLFEQCSRNTIALNSITHGGDGIFGFAGKEAIGDREGGPQDEAFMKRRGCNDNKIIGNDLSFAAAHGLEMTFSFGNLVAHNTFESNGICGIWGGYSQSTLIAENVFDKNGCGAGDTPNAGPGEGGAIDIEHGIANRIDSNTFKSEGVAIELWWDDDKAFLGKPWAKANGAESRENLVIRNAFEGCGTALALRQSTGTVFANNVGEAKVSHDDQSEVVPSDALPALEGVPTVAELAAGLPGINDPIGKHRTMGGREAIRMTMWAPWDGKAPILVLDSIKPDAHRWRLLGAERVRGAEVAGGGSIRLNTDINKHTFTLNFEMPGLVAPYLLRARFDESSVLFGEGCIYRGDWSVAFFPSPVDPRQDLDAWRAGATAADSVTVEAPAIDFRYGMEGPTSLTLDATSNGNLALAKKDGKLGADHFGMIARAKLGFPAGAFTIRTVSDDGVRVLVDGKPIIEDWSWHPPREAQASVTFEVPTEVEIVVEHFELDGNATVQLYIDGALDAKRRAIFGR